MVRHGCAYALANVGPRHQGAAGMAWAQEHPAAGCDTGPLIVCAGEGDASGKAAVCGLESGRSLCRRPRYNVTQVIARLRMWRDEALNAWALEVARCHRKLQHKGPL